MTQDSLGNAYGTLAEVEDKAGNCKRAIEACRQSLRVFSKEEFPELHQSIGRNLAGLIHGGCRLVGED